MALPHQVELSVTYDGTVTQAVTETHASAASGTSYTVVSGDTLWALAKRFYGSGAKYTIIYNANVDIIESTARAHGKSNSSNGHWIWPGTVLTIPSAAVEQATTTRLVKKGSSNPRLGKLIAKQATAFSYTDVASGQSDSVSITMHDIDKEWMGNLKPKRGASLGALLKLINWNKEERTDKFNCGTFVLDDISFSGRPLSCVLKGVSVPAMDDFKSKPRSQTRESTTIKDIASEIAWRTGVSLHYDADTIHINEIEQNKQTDSAFLYSLCSKYGLAMKVYNHKIVIFDIVKYEAKSAVITLNETDLLSWSHNETVEGTYTGVDLNYTDPDTEDTINVTMGRSGRMYAINTQASSRFDAELQAAAKVNEANRKIETMEVTIRANPKIVASHCVKIKGLENLDGKYYVDKIVHSAGKGYTMKLTLHRVQTPIKVTAPARTVQSATYVVVSGDTLWGISRRFYGTGTKYNIIYDANVDIIETTAKSRGKTSSGNGHWIFPGTVLVIPGV